MGDNKLTFCKYLLVDTSGAVRKTQEKVCELLKYRNEYDVLEEFRSWSPPLLPVSGTDLLSFDIPKGPLYKRIIDEIRQKWKYSDFKLTKEELLEMVPQILEEVKSTPVKKSPKPKRKRRN